MKEDFLSEDIEIVNNQIIEWSKSIKNLKNEIKLIKLQIIQAEGILEKWKKKKTALNIGYEK